MSERFELKAQDRIPGKKTINRQLRQSGFLPAEAYGKDFDNKHLAVPARDLLGILHSESGLNSFIHLMDEKGKEIGVFVIRDLDIDPVRHVIRNVDFEKISMDRVMEFDIPLHFIGLAPGVKKGGILEELHREVAVRCNPKDIIDYIEVDVSELEFGETISIGELQDKFPKLEFIDPPETTLVTISAPEEEIEEEEEMVEEEESLEPEVITEKSEEEEEKEEE